jgi:hypothetical protein
MAHDRTRPGNRPVEQQERSPADVEATRLDRIAISGPGAADFLTAQSGLDTPESGGKGTAQTRAEGPLDDPQRLVPRLGPDTEAYPSERRPEESITGAQSGTIGGGGAEAHNPSPVRATGVDDPTVSTEKP